MIIYMGIRNGKTVLVRVNTTTSINKINIPKSIITDKGIFDTGTVEDERSYIDSIQVESYKDTARLDRLVEAILPTLSNDDSFYIVDDDVKKLIIYLDLHKRYKCLKNILV